MFLKIEEAKVTDDPLLSIISGIPNFNRYPA